MSAITTRSPAEVGPDELLSIALDGLSPESARIYRGHYRSFMRYLGADSPGAALGELIKLDREQAEVVLADFRADMERRGRSAATIEQAGQAPRRAVRQLRRAGLTTLDLDIVRSERVEPEDGELLSLALDGLRQKTKEYYRRIYYDFARFRRSSVEDALRVLFGSPGGDAHQVILDYLANLETRKLASDTIRVHATALKAAVRQARAAGLTSLTLDIRRPHGSTAIQARGKPGVDDWRRLLARARAEVETEPAWNKRPARNLALILLVYELALRPGEVLGLDLADVDLKAGKIRVLGRWMKIDKSSRAALVRWLEARGSGPGPLFTREQNRAGGPERLGRLSPNNFIKSLARRAGIKGPITCEGLHQAAIARAIERGGDPRDIQAFCRFTSTDPIRLRAPGLGSSRARRPAPPHESSRPSPPPIVSWSYLVQLDGPDGRPLFLGRTGPDLSAKTKRVLRALRDAGPDGLTGAQMRRRSGCGGWRRMLDDLARESEDFASMYFRAESRTGHYRIGFPVPSP